MGKCGGKLAINTKKIKQLKRNMNMSDHMNMGALATWNLEPACKTAQPDLGYIISRKIF